MILAPRDIIMIVESHLGRELSWVSTSDCMGTGNLRTQSAVTLKLLGPCLLYVNNLTLCTRKRLVWNSPDASVFS